VFHKAGADALPSPFEIGRQLSEKQVGNRVGRLADADRLRKIEGSLGRRAV
jgi:hypothetical protein